MISLKKSTRILSCGGYGGCNVASCGYKCYMLQDYIYLQQYIKL